MALCRIEGLTFTYPGAGAPALDSLSLEIGEGEFLTLCGPSGCGKTTLLRCLKPALAPHGARAGRVFFRGEPLEALSPREGAACIGFVLQDPEEQIVTDKVWHELAFGLESLGLPREAIRARVAETASFFGMEGWFRRDTASLSGGQKQLLSLAAAVALGPDLLLLDEPTSQLDPIAARAFLDCLARLNRELGIAVVLSEHRLEEALPLSHRCALLDGGRLAACAPPRQLGEALRAAGHPMFAAMPTPMRVWAAAPGSAPPCPVTAAEGRRWLGERAAEVPLRPLPPAPVPPEGPPALEAEGLWFRYGPGGEDVLRGLDLSVPEGCLFALLGGNGAGKSTLLSLLSGAAAPQRGTVRLLGRPLDDWPEGELYHGGVALLPQDPRALFAADTVAGELADMTGDREAVSRVVSLCRLEGLLDRHPYDLSGGERQRAALAKVLLTRPRVLLLDEPTKGMDAPFQAAFAAVLADLCRSGVTVLMVSHDVEFCARHAHLCALLFDGAVAACGSPRDFFPQNRFYTTAAVHMGRELAPGAVTAEDLIAACGGVCPPAPEDAGARAPVPPLERAPAPSPGRKAPARPRQRISPAALALLLLVPLTLLLGAALLQNRRYYLISLALLFEALAPMLLRFESGRTGPRRLAVLACLTALAAAGRAALFMLPQFKPMAAVAILAGVSLGGEAGFVVGAASMLVSNFFFVQGVWTPWQMAAMGLIGLLAGWLAPWVGKNRLSLCLYGFFTVVLLYGGVMNPASVLMAQPNPTWEMVAASWALGLPVDVIHGGATAFFLWAGGPALLRILERVKTKYGLEGGQ